MERSIDRSIEETKKVEKAYITFSQKMIAWTKEHSDKTKIDIHTGEVMKICAVKLPSKEYRSMQFAPDTNGIDRNERIATINVVQSYIKDNHNKEGKLLNHYTYLDPNREYNVNFKGMEIGQENGKKIYDKPEQIKITGKDLTKMFKESRERSFQMKTEKSAEKEEKEKSTTKARKTAKTKARPKKTKKTEVAR